MNTYQIHIDTATATNVITMAGSAGQPTINKISGNPFNFTAILGDRHRTVRSVALKDAQIPIGWSNIRAPYNTFVLNTTTYTVPPGNYTIQTLVTQLNNTITGSVGNFTLDSTNNILTLTSVSGTLTFKVAPLSLGYFLGFTNGQTGTTIKAANTYFINFDTYVNVWITEVGTSAKDITQITYKIPNTSTFGNVIQYTESTAWKQCVRFTDRSNRLDRFTIKVLDRFGNIITNGIDWALTLEIQSDT